MSNFIEKMQELKDQEVSIETIRDSLQGKLKEVAEDYIEIKEKECNEKIIYIKNIISISRKILLKKTGLGSFGSI